jgi:hypothetical protein
MESVLGEEAGLKRKVAMTTDQERVKELEKKLKEKQDELTVYKIYFQTCAESETDPQKKRFFEQLANAEDSQSLSKLHCPF